MKARLFLFLFPFLFLSMISHGQTIINPGDLVILGVDANLGGNPDEISFACFKDITTGTEIQITDQGYERCYAGWWGSGEGGARLTRTGGTIPAGTVITFRTAQPTSPYIVFTYPDTLWSIASLGSGAPANSFNLNSGGDQVYFAQGGTWTPDTLCSNHYPGLGGRMLFAFSTSGSWISFGNSTQQSGLYPGMSCYNMVAPASASDFVKYTGLLTAATQKDWITRIGTITNWTKFNTSALYLAATPNLHATILPIIPGTDADWTSPAPICESASSINLNSLISGAGMLGGTWSGTGVTVNMFDPSGLNGVYNITYTIDCPCCISQTHTITVTNITALASSNSAICEGQNLSLTSSGGTIYSWSGPNGFVSSSQNPTITSVSVAASGIYTVSVTNAGGCTSTAQTTVVVNTNPSGNASSNSAICEGQDLNLTSSGGTSYSWTGPNGFSSSSQNPTITSASIAASGTYTVTVTSGGSCSDIVQTTVVINPNPSATASSDSAICEGQTLHLTSSGGTTYSWSGPNGFTSSSQNPAIAGASTAAAGTYTVTVTNSGGCSDIVQTIVIVNSIPVASASSDSAICEGQTLHLTSSGGTTYSWSGPDGFASSSQSPTIAGTSIAAAGTYTVTVTNSGGCSDTVQTIVIVNSIPLATASSNSAICEGLSLNLTSSGGTTYSWTGPNSFSSSLQNPTIPGATISAIGTYNVIVTDAGGCSDTASVVVSVFPLPTAHAGNDTTIAPGGSAQLIGSGGGSYLWTPSDGLSCTTCFNPIATPTDTTTYVLEVTDGNGCTDFDTITVFVHNDCGKVFIPNAFSPNGDGHNDVLCIRGNCIKTMTFAIYDRWGEMVFQSTDLINCWDGTFEGKPMNPDVFVYYLNATLIDGTIVENKGNITLFR